MIKLPKVVSRRGKRLGRGYGSGKGGHTSGRGQKGQKSRKSLGILFEGVKVKKSLIKRLPLRRGKGRFPARSKPLIVKTAYLNLLPGGSLVNLDVLIKYKIIDKKDGMELGVKILGDGKLTKKLTISLPISKSAAKDIEKAGGKIEKVDLKVSKRPNSKAEKETTNRK
jgi:large subunit ribosomal protein L15